jgi:hypothetical protein
VFPLNAVFAASGEVLAAWLGNSRLLTRVVTTRPGGSFEAWISESTLRRSSLVHEETRRAPHVRYFESQLTIVDIVTGHITHVGPQGVYRNVSGSPDGQYALVHRCRPSRRFADRVERWPTFAEVWALDPICDECQIIYEDSEPSGGSGLAEYGTPGRWHWHPLNAEHRDASSGAGGQIEPDDLAAAVLVCDGAGQSVCD